MAKDIVKIIFLILLVEVWYIISKNIMIRANRNYIALRKYIIEKFLQ